MLKRIDKKPVRLNKTDILAFVCIRNERERLPFFLKHHRSIGVNHFFFVDNGSDDKSIDYLLSQDDTFIFQTFESYAESNYGMVWINNLLSTYGVNHWTLTLDADELFIYPNYEQTNLRMVSNYLDKIKADAVKSFLLDMYSNKPIVETNYKADESFIETCPFFDKNTYKFEKGVLFKKNLSVPIRGGVRERIFWEGFDRKIPSPILKKYPFVKWRKDLYFKISTHIIGNITEGDITGVLLHFKLFSDFYSSARTESKRNEHWQNASQYKTYWDILNDNKYLNPFYKGSICYENSKQLIDLKLMHSSSRFTEFIKTNDDL